jgi:hypothetical protein
LAPSFKTIRKFYNEFNNDGSVLERKRRRQRSPSKSTRKAAQLGMSRRLVQRILKSDSNLYPYKITVLPKLTVENKHQRMAFAEWAQKNEVSFNSVWFFDEAHFHLDGVVNTQHVRAILGVRESTCDS